MYVKFATLCDNIAVTDLEKSRSNGANCAYACYISHLCARQLTFYSYRAPLTQRAPEFRPSYVTNLPFLARASITQSEPRIHGNTHSHGIHRGRHGWGGPPDGNGARLGDPSFSRLGGIDYINVRRTGHLPSASADAWLVSLRVDRSGLAAIQVHPPYCSITGNCGTNTTGSGFFRHLGRCCRNLHSSVCPRSVHAVLGTLSVASFHRVVRRCDRSIFRPRSSPASTHPIADDFTVAPRTLGCHWLVGAASLSLEPFDLFLFASHSRLLTSRSPV